MKRIIMNLLLLALLFYRIPSAAAADLADVQIHGFVSQGFFLSNDNNYNSVKSTDGSFQFNELGIVFGKRITDDLRLGMQLFSRDYGRTGNNKVEIDWAFGDYRWRNWLGMRAGLLKMSHGLYNESRDQDMVRTAILLPQSVYPEMVRDYYTRMWGTGFYGNVFTNSAGGISYNFLAGTYNPDAETSGIAILLNSGGNYRVEKFNHDEGIQYCGNLIWETPLRGLRLAASGWIMKNAGADVRYLKNLGTVEAGTVRRLEAERWTMVYSVEYRWKSLLLAAEYRLENTKRHWADDEPSEIERDAEGYYASASYRFTDWLEIGTYYSIYYPNKDDRDGDSYKMRGMDDFWAWQNDLAFTARFDINDYWLLKLEGHSMDGAADTLSIDNPDGVRQHDYLFAAKVTFSF